MSATLRLSLVAIAVLFFISETSVGAGSRKASSLLYELIDLGVEGPRPDGPIFSEAHGINEAGIVVGETTPGHAFVWTRRGGLQPLPPLGVDYQGGISAVALDINNRNVIVGASTSAGLDHRRATMWTRGVPEDLGVLGTPPVPGMIGSVANAINDKGQVVGESNTAPEGFSHAFLWTRAAGMRDLGVLGVDPDGNRNSHALDINNHGIVVGGSSVSTTANTRHAFAWTRQTGLVDIGSTWPVSAAWAISNKNWATGSGIDPQVFGGEVALLWPRSLKILNLGPGPIGFDESQFAIGFGVSEAGHVVGVMSSPIDPFTSGFLWTRHVGRKIDLNDVLDETGDGWRVYRAEDVNSKGQIAGSACHATIGCHAVLLNPVRAR